MSFIGDKEYKKEEMHDYDYVRILLNVITSLRFYASFFIWVLFQILSQDGVANKTEEAEVSSMFHVEPKLEVLEDRVTISVENVSFFDRRNLSFRII